MEAYQRSPRTLSARASCTARLPVSKLEVAIVFAIAASASFVKKTWWPVMKALGKVSRRVKASSGNPIGKLFVEESPSF